MDASGRLRRSKVAWAGLVAVALQMTAGCAGSQRQRAEVFAVRNPGLGPMTIAVAPAINLSGSSEFDPARFADLMASELSYVDEVAVIPVSRVLGVLAAQGTRAVESPAHALEVAGLVGADAILVFAVTEYDPYEPPSVGISAQLFGRRPGPGERSLDPVAMSRQARLSASADRRSADGLLAQTQRVFDAAHGAVTEDIRRFASFRGGDDSPYGWRKYVVSQEEFVRYCCHATLRELAKTPPAGEGEVD